MRKAHAVSCIATAFAALGYTAPASSQEIYLKAGFLGGGVGYAYGVNDAFTLRGDVSTSGRFDYTLHVDDVDYRGPVRNDTATIYADWFPFRTGFRLTAGLSIRNTEIKTRGMYAGMVPAGLNRPDLDAQYYVDADVTYPRFAPYLGLGWGHNVAQRTKPGWGFIFDAGVSFGKPKVNYTVSDALWTRLNMVPGVNAQAEVDKRKNDLQDKAFQVFPSVFLGISYTF